jgi:hypothetical protein
LAILLKPTGVLVEGEEGLFESTEENLEKGVI